MPEDIKTALSNNWTYDFAEYAYLEGRIDSTDWELYKFYWRNGAARFSNIVERYELKST